MVVDDEEKNTDSPSNLPCRHLHVQSKQWKHQNND